MKRRGYVNHIKSPVAFSPCVLSGQSFRDTNHICPINRDDYHSSARNFKL